MEIRVKSDLDVSYVLSTIVSHLWVMGKQNVGVLGLGIQVSMTEIMLPTEPTVLKQS